MIALVVKYGSMEYFVLKIKYNTNSCSETYRLRNIAAEAQRPQNVSTYFVSLMNEIRLSINKCAHLPSEAMCNTIGQNAIDQVVALRNLETILRRKYTDGEILIVVAVHDIYTVKLEFLEETLLNLPQPKPNNKISIR
jgi:carbonic anhydrase